MNLKRTIAIAASLIAVSVPSMAAPSVSGVSGTVSNGQSITINGSGFGVKSPAAPYLWADFASGINPSSRGVKTSWDAVQSMAWSSSEGVNGGGAAKSSDSNGAWTLQVDYNSWTDDNQHFYVYKRTKQNFMITSTTQNWKQFRMWSSGMTFPDVYFAPSNGECYVEDITGSGFYGSFNPSSTNWITEEIIGKASSSPGVKDGSLVFRVDGSQKTSGALMTSNSTYPNRMTIMYPVHGVAANKGSWSPGWSSSNAIWADNVYVDTTWARVMVGDASSFSSCRTLDIQIPTAWADGSVSVVMNTSSFSSGANAYLYVIDKDGNVNANGYAVTIGQGSTQTNAAPVVSAGSDQTIALGSTAHLTGTASDDGLPNPPASLSLSWSQVSGPVASTIQNGTTLTPTISFTTAGTYVFRLTGSDSVLSTSDNVTVVVQSVPTNAAPAVSAGSDQAITLGSTAHLTGTASDDGLPNPPASLSLSWSQVSGPVASTIQNGTTLTPTISFTTAGTYVFRLTGSDSLLSTTDNMTVIVQPVNLAPTVNAGGNKTVTLGSSIQLTATASDDGLPTSPGALTLSWSQVSGPASSSIQNASTLTPTITFPVAGAYVFRLTASDGALSTTSDATVTVQPVNQSPLVSAGANQQINLGTTAQLHGVATDDGLPTPPAAVTTHWTQVSGPGASTIQAPNSLSTGATFPAAGIYVLRLTASDGSLSASADVSIAVNETQVANQAPLVSAGANQTVSLGATAQLQGVATDDGLPTLPGTVSVTWTQVSGPATALIQNTHSVAASVNFTTAGTYVFRLSGTDGSLTSAADTSVTVNTAPTVVMHGSLRTKRNQMIWLIASLLDATPNPNVTALWTLASGPAEPQLTDPSALSTEAMFPAEGNYLLMLTVSDGTSATSSTLSVVVEPATEAVADRPVKNVFNPARGESASLPYLLKSKGSVKILIYDRNGQRIKELTGDDNSEGQHTLSWDGRNENGSVVASGIYIAVAQGSEGTRSHQKLAVVK